jgi:serine/threonine-protein kinase
MPFIEGGSLRQRLMQERRLDTARALAIAGPVADALMYAHRMGVLHRDIKPENILFSQGHPIVADFGIAKAISTAGGANLTRTGFPLGTPGYMSPEQAAGLTDLDERTDVYSLAVWSEMLVGDSGPLAHEMRFRAEPRSAGGASVRVWPSEAGGALARGRRSPRSARRLTSGGELQAPRWPSRAAATTRTIARSSSRRAKSASATAGGSMTIAAWALRRRSGSRDAVRAAPKDSGC